MNHTTRLILVALVWIDTEYLLGQTEYTADGTPTAFEEEIRWHLNHGRFDSASENRRRGTAFADVPATGGPLAPSQSLTLAARRHSEDMAKKDVFQHETVRGSAYYDPTTQPEPWDKMEAEGDRSVRAAENIAAGYRSAAATYVGWWHSSGHRKNMYNLALREIGNGYFNWVGSRYYTMDLGSSGSTRFFTDTLFYDANGDGIYDQGEGVAGVRISLRVQGLPHNYIDLSTASGSFAVPTQSLPLNSIVEVLLANTTLAEIRLSTPNDYWSYTPLTLAPGEQRQYGAFVQPDVVQNLGLRNVLPHPHQQGTD